MNDGVANTALPAFVERLIARGIAPIQPRYIAALTAERAPVEVGDGGADSARQWPAAVPSLKRKEPVDTLSSSRALPDRQQQHQQTPRSGPQTGTVPRLRAATAAAPPLALCNFTIRGEPCPFDAGDTRAGGRASSSCRFSHDAAAYVATKEPDLGPRCHVFDALAHCPHGVTCRFADAHGAAAQVNNAATAAASSVATSHSSASAAASSSFVSNRLPAGLAKQLRKRQVELPRAARITQLYEAYSTQNKTQFENVRSELNVAFVFILSLS
jgi:hypothetical protein